MNYISFEVREAAVARARVLRARAMHALVRKFFGMVRRTLPSSAPPVRAQAG
jgi:hypothetical protein